MTWLSNDETTKDSEFLEKKIKRNGTFIRLIYLVVLLSRLLVISLTLNPGPCTIKFSITKLLLKILLPNNFHNLKCTIYFLK